MFRCTVVTNIPAVHSQNLGKTFLTDSVLGKHNLLCWQRNRLENQSLICEVDPFHGQQSMQCMSKDSNLFIRRNSHSLFILTTRFCSFPSTFFFGGGDFRPCQRRFHQAHKALSFIRFSLRRMQSLRTLSIKENPFCAESEDWEGFVMAMLKVN